MNVRSTFARVAWARPCVVLAAAVAFSVTHGRLRAWSVDDAGITYAYSIGLADRGSLSPLPESMPVEGYSNPLLFLFVALLRILSLFDPITTHTKIELITFALMALLVFELLRVRLAAVPSLLGTGVFVVLELITPATWLWYSSGLENSLVTLTLLTLVLVADRASRTGTFQPILVGMLCFVGALVRPEAPVYVASFYVALLLTVRPPDVTVRVRFLRLFIAGSITAGLYVAFLVWRYKTYGVWFPNTYFAKLGSGPAPVANIRDYLIPVVFPYASSLLFALSVLILGLQKPARDLAVIVGTVMLASVVMPIIGGNDMMGEHRFATPFLAMSHVSIASLIAVVYGMRDSIAAPSRRLLLALASLPVVAFAVTRTTGGEPTISTVTTSKVVEIHGVRRMQHQRRLGVINPVVIAPDAGGVLLFGSLQYIDNGYLTDFQMAHMTRDLKVMTQYQTVERVADLADTNPTWGTFDRTQIPSVYLAPVEEHMFARRSLVELGAPPPVDPTYAESGLRLYVSPETVLAAGPRGLVRIEVDVAWTSEDALTDMILSGSILGDDDEIRLTPYGDLANKYPATGIQRRALLLRAPPVPGAYDVVLKLRRGENDSFWTRSAVRIEVLTPNRVQTAIDAIVNSTGSTADQVMRRFAWLREQYIPRLSQQTLRKLQRQLVRAYVDNSPAAGRIVSRLIWDARLASLSEELPAEFRAAEQQVVERVLNNATCSSPSSPEHRALCIGRSIDRLRRFGYFGVLGRLPTVRAALLDVNVKLKQLDRPQMYVALVGLNLAMPENVQVQKRVLRARDAFASSYSWPALAP